MGDDGDGGGGAGPAGDATNEEARLKMKKLETENKTLRSELDEAKSEIAVTVCVRENLVELERQKTALETELETMRQLLQESHDESAAARTGYEHELAKTVARVDQLTVENHELKFGNVHGGAALAASAGDAMSSLADRETLLGGAAVISDATKSFARRMKSNLLPTSGEKVPPSSSTGASPLPTSGAGAAASPSKEQGNLEDGMRRAYEDTELLKSIVVPLEEQIGALKDKLRETDSLLREHERRQGDSLLGVEALANWLQGQTSVEEAMAALLQKSETPELDKSNEVYVALMSARYSLLNSELGSVRRDHDEVKDLLERERAASRRLRREAAISDSEMIRVQKESLAELSKMQAVLTEEQKAELLKPPAAAPPPEKSETATKDKGESDARGTGVDDGTTAEEEADTGTLSSPPGNDDNSTVLMADSSPESSPLHVSTSPSALGDDDLEMSPPTATKTVSQAEWDELQKELSKVRTLFGVTDGEGLVGTDAYRKLQGELADAKKECGARAKNEERLKEDLSREAVYRREVEEKWNERAESHKSETEALNKQLMEVEGLLEQLRISYGTMYEAMRKDLKTLTADREKVVKELKRLQGENDVLVGKHNKKSEVMHAEAINLPEGSEEAQLMLLQFREELIAAKVSEERATERLAIEVGQARNELVLEQRNRHDTERRLTAELEELGRRCQLLDRYKKELEEERRLRKEAEEAERVRRDELDTMKSDRDRLESKAAEMKNRIGNLQQELDNSVAVQTDFVRLSQSLQMELEKIRQSEKEVRWQHEDDVSACQGCKSGLTANRRKHHCRHCGRIFCSDCVTKTVRSGPTGRPAKVCDVCHTLLVQNSAPYFSTEAPSAANK